MKKRFIQALAAGILLAAVAVFTGKTVQNPQKDVPEKAAAQTEVVSVYAGVIQAFQQEIFDSGILTADPATVLQQTPQQQAEAVYTFLQGPKSFEQGYPWAGAWCQNIVNGNSFGGFGCGLCCMANIYSTLSPYECSPWDMYTFATQASLYYPSEESGAIGWDDMVATLQKAGLTCGLFRKPATYEEFQEMMKQNPSAIVLVSSGEDDSFWTNTSGHYVNIWLYQQGSDEVFLAEPGDPERNRSFIPLRYVYDALKTVSNYQILAVSSYQEEANQWKWNGIDIEWNGKSQ